MFKRSKEFRATLGNKLEALIRGCSVGHLGRPPKGQLQEQFKGAYVVYIAVYDSIW